MFEDFRLRVFVTVADAGSFTEAAHRLGVTQPAVSQNVAELEKLVGEPLFLRAHGSVTLTDAGRRMSYYAGRILYWYEKADSELVRKKNTPDMPVLMKLDDSRGAEITVIDGELNIKIKALG